MAIITERRKIQIVEVGENAEEVATAVFEHIKKHGLMLPCLWPTKAKQLWTYVPWEFECQTLLSDRVVFEISLQRILVGEAEKRLQ